MLCWWWWCWLEWSARVSERVEAWEPAGTWQLQCWKCSHNSFLFVCFFFYLKMKNLLDSKWLCQAMFLCPMGCTFVSSFQYWTSEGEAAMDKADLCRQDGGMSHRSTCARGRRCWARGAPWTGASGLLQGQYQHKKKNKMQSLEAVQGSLLMEIRFWVQECLLSEI